MLDSADSIAVNLESPSNFKKYIDQGQKLAENAGLNWYFILNSQGVADKSQTWDLRKVIKDGNPVTAKLKNFSNVPRVLEIMIQEQLTQNTKNIVSQAVSPYWQDLIKTYTLNLLLIAGNSVSHITASCGMLRFLATVVENKEPWRLDADDIIRSIKVAHLYQPSGQIAVLIIGFIKTVFDAYYLSEACPLSPLIFNQSNQGTGRLRAKYLNKETALQKKLNERKAEQKLPTQKAFWELMRIVFSERPRTFLDAIRFAQVKVMVITGLRIGEISLLPLDWKRSIEYRDRDGVLAGERGGFSKAYYLRYFAEKQGSTRNETGTLYETSQFIPSMFEGVLFEALDDIERLTSPLRETLKAQCETGRLFPMYESEKMLSAELCYLHMTGNVLLRDINEKTYNPYIDEYKKTLDVAILDRLIEVQRTPRNKPHINWLVYVSRMQKKGVIFRDIEGRQWVNPVPANQYLRIGELESYIRKHTPTKVSDTSSFKISGERKIQPWEFLFLTPKRSLAEERNDLPCHVGWNINISIATPEVLGLSLYGKEQSGRTLFQNYGLTEEDRLLTLKPHSFRHLQNTELFRLGVADTVITKRFNRHSVAQSYEYDHRSLQEELSQITLPDEWEAYLGPKASTVAKMVQAGYANGPIVKEFKNLQVTEGDESAYSFLKAEADGFHATPYGHCLNSFTVDPCPTNLECFNGCRHLSATNLPENRQHLLRLKGKLQDALEAAQERPSTSIGRTNQIEHATVRLAGVTRLLETPTGERVFPDGVDLSISTNTKSVLHGT